MHSSTRKETEFEGKYRHQHMKMYSGYRQSKDYEPTFLLIFSGYDRIFIWVYLGGDRNLYRWVDENTCYAWVTKCINDGH